jgi:hypothetical protein
VTAPAGTRPVSGRDADVRPDAAAGPGGPHRGPERERQAEQARRLVDAVAPALGLVPAEVRVHLGTAGRPALDVGARGLVADRQAFVAADPGTREGRGVLVHELVHLAQQQVSAPVSPKGSRSRRDPEAEARALAAAFLEGRVLRAPVVPLHPSARAADTGTLAPPRPAPLVDSGATGLPAEDAAAVEVQTGLLSAELGRVVSTRHADARAEIRRQLGGLWVDGGDVTSCLQVLDTLPFLVARAVARSLPTDEVLSFASHLTPAHHRQSPSSAVAVLSAMHPMQLRRLEPGNVEGLDTRGFGPVELRGALTALRGLRHGVLVALLRGERAAFFTGLMTGAAPGGDDRDALRSALASLTPHTVEQAAAGSEAMTAATRTALDAVRTALRSPSQPRALHALQLLADLAPAPPAASAVPAPPTTGSSDPGAPAPHTAPPPPEPGRQLRLAVAQLDTEGLVGRLLDALPGSARRADSDQAARLLVVLAARAPFRTLALIEDHLSYGLFDWAVTDSDARFAYLLVRSLPLAQQERWRRLDDGKWFARLEENLPREDVLHGAYRGVGRSAGDALATSGPEADREAAALRVVTAIDEAVQRGVDGPTAVRLLRQLLSLSRGASTVERAPTSGTPGDPDGTSARRESLAAGAGLRRVLAIAVGRLDALGDLDPVLDALPDSYLLNEMWRSEVLEVLAVRDPRHLERHARRLLSRGLLDWAVTSREAWLAFQLVRNLSAEDQIRLQQEDPDRYARITTEMTPGMRASASVTVMSGQATLATRDRLRRRLADPDTWHAAHAVELRSLVIQLYALDDARWVFLRSRDVRAHADPGLAELVSQLRLYAPGVREHFDPEQLRAPGAVADALGLIGRVLEVTPYGIGLALRGLASMFTTEVGLSGVDLERLQPVLAELGIGGLEGLRLQPRPTPGTGAATTATADLLQAREANRFSVWIRPSQHKLGLELPQLDLAGLLQTGPGWSLRTGRASLTGLSIVVDYSDRHFTTPTAAVMDVGAVDITDVVLAKADALIAATRAGAGDLHLRAGQRDTTELAKGAPPGSLPVPVVFPLLHFVHNYFELFGTLPGLSGGLGSITTPPGLSFLADQFTSRVNSAVLTPLAESVLGLVTDGAFRPPRDTSTRVADAAAMMRSVEVAFADLSVEGLSFGGGQQVASLRLRDVVLGVGLSRTTVLRRQIASARRRLAGAALPADQRPELRTRLTSMEQELAALVQAELALDRLEARSRVDESALDDTERSELTRLSRLLRRSAGGALDIGSISIGAMSGTVEAAGLEIGAIHAEATVPSLAGEHLPVAERATRFQAEGAGPSLGDVARRGRAEATVASVRLVTRDGAPALRLLGALPEPAVVEAELQSLVGDDPVTARRRDELRPWPLRLRRLAALESLDPEPTLPDGSLNPRRARAVDLAEREQLRREAQLFFGTSVGAMTLSGVTARLSAATLGVDLDVADLDLRGIRAGSTRVERVHGTHVGGGVALEATAGAAPTDAQSRRMRELGLSAGGVVARVHGQQLTLTGVERPGTTAESVGLRGLRASVVPVGEDYAMALHLDAVDLVGVDYASPVRRVFAGGATTLGPLDAALEVVTAPDTSPGAPAGARQVSRVLIRSMVVDRIEAADLGVESRQPAPGYVARMTGGALVGVRITDLPVELGGERLRLDSRISVDQLEQLRFAVVSRAFSGPPTTLTGTLDSPPVATGSSARALEIGLLSSGDTTLDARGTTLTEGRLTTSSGSISVRRLGLASASIVQEESGRLRFSDLSIPSLDVSGLDWATAGGRVTSSGSTLLEGITSAGSWTSEPDRQTAAGVVAGRRELRIDALHVDRIRSDDLHYRQGTMQFSLGSGGGRRPDLLDVRDLDVRGLRWSAGDAPGSPTGLQTGTVSTGSVAVDLSARISAQLGAVGQVRAAGISATLLGEGGTMFRATGLTGHVGVTDGTGALQQAAGFVGGDTGAVVLRGNTVEIGPAGSPGLDIPVLHLDRITWAGSPLGIATSPAGGGVSLAGIRARASIVLRGAGDPPGPPVRRLLLRELVVAEVRASGLVLTLGDGKTVSLDEEEDAVIGGVTLLPAPGEEGFLVEADETGALVPTGRLVLGALRLPWVRADIRSSLMASANVGAAGLTADFLGARGLDVDLREPTVAGLMSQLSGGSRHVLELVDPSGDERAWALRAAGVRYESRTGPGGTSTSRVSVTGTELRGLHYADPSLGLTVDVRHGAAPGTVVHDLSSGAGVLPDLAIDDARFSLDLPTLMAGSGPSAARPLRDVLHDVHAALSPNAMALRSISGSVRATLATSLAGTAVGFPIDLRLRQGAVDLEHALTTVQRGIPFLTLRTRGNQLQFGANVPVPTGGGIPTVVRVPLLSWTLTTGELEHHEMTGESDILRLLAPTGTDWVLDQSVGGGGSGSSGPSDTRLRDLRVDLSMKSSRAIPIDLGAYGALTMAPEAIAHLALRGELGGSTAAGGLPGLVVGRLERVSVQSARLLLGGTQVSTGALEVTGVDDLRLGFSGTDPQVLSGHITRATARGIRWQRRPP